MHIIPLIAVITLTLGRSSLFWPLRRAIATRFPRLGEMIQCPYCLTHWTAAALTPWGPGWLWRWGLNVAGACLLMGAIKYAILLVGRDPADEVVVEENEQ